MGDLTKMEGDLTKVLGDHPGFNIDKFLNMI